MPIPSLVINAEVDGFCLNCWQQRVPIRPKCKKSKKKGKGKEEVYGKEKGERGKGKGERGKGKGRGGEGNEKRKKTGNRQTKQNPIPERGNRRGL